MSKELYAEKAEKIFREGYNCSQAVVLAFENLTGLDREAAARLSSSFGGGMGRLREVCGAVSGALFVLGAVCGYSEPSDSEAKKAHYALVQEFAKRFKAENGSIICRELLSGVETSGGGVPEQRTPDFYKKRPCARLVASAAEITAELLIENGKLRKYENEEDYYKNRTVDEIFEDFYSDEWKEVKQ
jgi:C_GCAxxG_C_C family probable redox protein